MAAAEKIISPVGRVSFPDVFQARAFEEGKPKKYSVTLLLDPADAEKLQPLVRASAVEKWGAKAKAMLENPKFINPIRDGAEKDYDGYEGKQFIKFSRLESQGAPKVVNEKVHEITEDSGDFYAGCYAKVSFTVKAFDNVSKGVNFYLNNVQKVADGEPFAGGSSAEDDFGPAAPVTEDDGSDLF